MRKKKVLSFFGFLALFTLGLAAFNVLHFGSLTGKVIAGSDYQEELFFGRNYEFKFYPSTFDSSADSLLIKGQVSELAGLDHNVQITAYSLDASGNVIGSYSGEAFLASDDTLNLAFNIYSPQSPSKTLIYIEDERTSVRVEKILNAHSSVATGQVTRDISDVGNYGTFAAGFVIFASLIAFILYRMKEHKKSVNLSHALSHKHTRKYIDIDVR